MGIKTASGKKPLSGVVVKRLNTAAIWQVCKSNLICFKKLVLILLSTIAVSLGGSLYVVYVFRVVAACDQKEHRAIELNGIIVHLDEVLTMSARMAAATSDLKWEQCYRNYESQLDAAIEEAIGLVEDTSKKKSAIIIYIANIKLVAMENEAFNLVREDHPQAAFELLNNPEYEKQKLIYADGIAQFSRVVQEHTKIRLLRVRYTIWATCAFAVIAVVMAQFLYFSKLRLRKLLTEYKESEKATMNLLEDLGEAKTSLEKSKASFHNIVEEGTDGIVVVDQTGTVQYVNPATEVLLGRKEEELIGKPFRFPVMTNETTEIDIAGPNKEHGIAEMRIVETRWNDQPARLALIRNITDRKQAEIKLQEQKDRAQKYLDVAGVMLLVIDQNGNVSLINKKGCEILEYEEHEIIGKNWFDNFIPERIREQIKTVEKRIKAGEAKELEYYENPVLTKSGQERLIAWHNTVLSDEDKKTMGSLCSGEDITERKKTEEKLKKTMKIKSEFTSTVSHELRTPLTAIKEGIGLVLDGQSGDINEEQKELLGIAKRNIDRLARLINDVLDFQKLASGRMKFDIQPNNINKTIKDVYEMMVSPAKNAGLDLLLELDGSLPKVGFDNDKITQVLTNLVTNAMKFTEKGSITIKTAQRDNEIEVSVSDTGRGIREKDLPRIFDEFEQLSRGGERKTGGTGLGLAISKELIEKHNGTIYVESVYGKGAKFTFTLPIHSSEELFNNYINDGIKKASKNDTKMSLILISIADFDKLTQELSGEKVDSILHNMEALLENNLPRADSSSSPAADTVLKLSGENFAILNSCNKEDILRVKERLEQILNDYLANQNMADKIKLLFGFATYPDDADTDEDLIMKAKELQAMASVARSV